MKRIYIFRATFMSRCNIPAVCKYFNAFKSWYMMYCLWTSSKIFARITACKSVSINSNTKYMSRSLSALRTFQSLMIFSWLFNSFQTPTKVWVTGEQMNLIKTDQTRCIPAKTWFLGKFFAHLLHFEMHRKLFWAQQLPLSSCLLLSIRCHMPSHTFVEINHRI